MADDTNRDDARATRNKLKGTPPDPRDERAAQRSITDTQEIRHDALGLRAGRPSKHSENVGDVPDETRGAAGLQGRQMRSPRDDEASE